MRNSIPKHLTTSTTISLELVAQNFDFLITYSVFGEVLTVKNHFFDLPKEAQRLMLGDKLEEILGRLRNEEKLFSYSVPLAILGYLKQETWQPFQEKAKLLQEKMDSRTVRNKYRHITNDWVREVHKLIDLKSRHQHLPCLGKVLETDGYDRGNALKKLGEYPHALGEPVLHALFPLLSHWQEINGYYGCLKNYPSESNYKLLSSALKDKTKENYHEGVMKGLLPYKYPNLHELLWNYQKSHTITNKNTQAYLLKGISKFSSPKVKQLLTEFLVNDNSEATKLAYEVLLEKWMNKKEMAATLRPAFEERKSINHLYYILLHYEYLGEPALWPTVEELIDLFEWNCNNFEETHIFYRIHQLVYQRLQSEDLKRIYTYLEHDNIYFRIGGIALLSNTKKEIHGQKIGNLLADKEKKVVEKAMNSLGHFTNNFKMPYLIPKLLQIIENNEDYARINAISTLKWVIKKTPTEEARDALFKLLGEEYPVNVRMEAIKTLSVYKSKEVEAALIKMTASSDRHIKTTAVKALSEYRQSSRLFGRKKERSIQDVMIDRLIDEMEKGGAMYTPFQKWLIKAFYKIRWKLRL